MKKISSVFDKLQNKHCIAAWSIFHGAILIFFLFTLAVFKGNLSVDSDLFNMLPRPLENESIRDADEKLSEATGQNVFILVKNEDFAKAKDSADQVYNKLLNSDNFKTLTLYTDMGTLSSVTDYIYKYRWNLLDEDSINLINNGGAQYFAQNALMQAYSPFTILPLDNLEDDPFMLAETDTANYLAAVSSSGTAFSVKDGVLASQGEGKWYVMIRGILSKKGAALASKNNGITEIYSVCNSVNVDGTEFVYSGTPYHSHKSSNSAVKEITIISSITMIIVILMLLIVFRSPTPILASVVSILISIGTAVITTLAVFQKLHILTLVFGTSLIGSCIDYSLHYFAHWAGNPTLTSGKEIRRHLLSGLILAIVSSSLCFAILLFAPFGLLKQMSLFSLSGLISSFLTTIALFPYIPLPKGERKLRFANILQPTSNKNRKQNIGRVGITALFIITIGLIFIFNKNVRIENDMYKLYSMKGTLLEMENEARGITKYFPTGWFIVNGDTEEEALRREEEVCAKIQEVTNGANGYISTSLFVPSIERQKKSRQACAKLLEYTEYQLEALGFDPSYADTIRAEFEASEGDYISLEKGNVPEYITSSLGTAWLGKLGKKYYTVVMPNRIDDPKVFKQLYENDSTVYFVSKMADLGDSLDKLTVMVLKFFLIAYALMFVFLKLFYNLKQTLKIVSIPLLIVLVTTAVFAVFNIKLEFFSVTGLILVFGLGLDYIIYMMENEKPKTDENKTLEPFAIMLSFITTIVSFGALALSSFVPVHLMGLSIFLGLATAYISSMLYDRSF